MPKSHQYRSQNQRNGLGSFLAAAMLAASLSVSHAPLFRDEELAETQQQAQDRSEGGKEQGIIRVNSKISQCHGLRYFMLGDVGVWALNIKNAERKFKKLNLC